MADYFMYVEWNQCSSSVTSYVAMQTKISKVYAM